MSILNFSLKPYADRPAVPDPNGHGNYPTSSATAIYLKLEGDTWSPLLLTGEYAVLTFFLCQDAPTTCFTHALLDSDYAYAGAVRVARSHQELQQVVTVAASQAQQLLASPADLQPGQAASGVTLTHGVPVTGYTLFADVINLGYNKSGGTDAPAYNQPQYQLVLDALTMCAVVYGQGPWLNPNDGSGYYQAVIPETEYTGQKTITVGNKTYEVVGFYALSQGDQTCYADNQFAQAPVDTQAQRYVAGVGASVDLLPTDGILCVDDTATVTLPDPTLVAVGQEFIIKCTHTDAAGKINLSFPALSSLDFVEGASTVLLKGGPGNQTFPCITLVRLDDSITSAVGVSPGYISTAIVGKLE